jgi:acetoin utilization deacetylase AcuC-like enzyme
MPSHLDVDLPDGTDDAGYLDRLGESLQQVAASGPYDLAIFLAGADPFGGDRLGRLALTKPGLAARDRAVLSWCRAHAMPVAIAMAGGYAPQIDDIVDIHAATVELASETYRSQASSKL